MRRRSLIGAAGLCATWRSAKAQPARKLHRIGVVVSQFKVADITGPQTQSPAVNALLAAPSNGVKGTRPVAIKHKDPPQSLDRCVLATPSRPQCHEQCA
jgi:hypothetical protein